MKLLRLTIRQRLPLFFSISAFIILLIQGFFVYKYSLQFCEEEFKNRIQKRLTEADSVISLDRAHPYTALHALLPGNLPDEQILYATDPKNMVLPNGGKLVRNKPDTAWLHDCTSCYAHVGQRDYGIRHDAATHHTLVVSAIDRYGMSKIQNLKRAIFLGILLGVLLLTLASWFWVKRMLQPIADKISKARSIGAKSLNLRLEIKNNHDELGELAMTFNEMLERIEQGFRGQQQFIRYASHEMRTPLTAIITEADLALNETRSPDHYRKSLENVRAQAENLNDLVAKLLVMASVDSSNSFNDRVCAAEEILLAALRALHAKYPLMGQSVRLEIEALAAAQFLVLGDPVILQAAFFNLLDNAMKYGNSQPIVVRLWPSEKSVLLEITDRGAGIPTEDLAQLFEPFFRSSRNNQVPGSGIGLSLTKSIVDKYGGSIKIDSELGIGTVARLMLPRYFEPPEKI